MRQHGFELCTDLNWYISCVQNYRLHGRMVESGELQGWLKNQGFVRGRVVYDFEEKICSDGESHKDFRFHLD